VKLVLANRGYAQHTTDEGLQLEDGLHAAGWCLAGYGVGDSCVDVPTLLARYTPRVVMVQDVRDWHRDNRWGCFDPRYHFARWERLRDCGAFVATPFKDAGSMPKVQAEFFQRVRPGALVTYYHPDAVREASKGAVSDYAQVRTYHTVDADLVRSIPLDGERRRGIVTGATGVGVYPLRQRVFEGAAALGIDGQGHPGYGNKGCDTARYLRQLAGYKVHVATASRFGFALRKIIESVALGCTPVTDLPAFDVLPEIDEVLVRVPSRISIDDLRGVIDEAERSWDLERALALSAKACAYYDYRVMGARLDAALAEAARGAGYSIP
jgi:hypothetical protein